MESVVDRCCWVPESRLAAATTHSAPAGFDLAEVVLSGEINRPTETIFLRRVPMPAIGVFVAFGIKLSLSSDYAEVSLHRIIAAGIKRVAT